MGGQGRISKYFIGIIVAVLLTRECEMQNAYENTYSDFPETSIGLQFSYTDGPQHHRRQRSSDQLEYFAVVEMNVSQAVVIEQIKKSLAYAMFPFQMDNNTEIIFANITTVCQSNVSEYQCICEDGYAWSYNNCQTYEACGDIGFGSCGCISRVPSDGEMCVLESVPSPKAPFTESPTPSEPTESLSTPTPLISTTLSRQSITPPPIESLSTATMSTLSTESPSSTESTSTSSISLLTPSTELTSPSTTTPSPTTAMPSPESPSATATQSTSMLTPFTESSSTATPSPSTPPTESQSTSVLTPSTESPSSVATQSTYMTSKPPTPSKSTLSTPAPSTQPTTMKTIVIGMSVKISQTFDPSLSDNNSVTYKDLSRRIESVIDTIYSNKLNGYKVGSTKVTGFRPGSVIADYTINATSNSLDFGAANAEVSDSLSKQGLILAEDAFTLSDQIVFTSDQLYPLQKVELNCAQPGFAMGQIKWTVDNKDPALDNTRYFISNDNSTLTVKNATESDSGRYSCIIQGNIPYVQWQNITIKKSPSINVGEKERYFFCDGSRFQLICSVDVGYNIEWVLGENVLTSGNGTITYNYTMQNVNCTEKIFTCRLRDLPQLKNYGYSQSSVRVRTIAAGDANVLDVIHKLTSKVEFLTGEEIPVFMANLSSSTEQYENNISHSSATVQAIVDILSKIADLSESVVINEPVMRHFLKTVDIIISDNFIDTWNKLTTNNTSIKLLSAIENISGHLTDEFVINEKSIQLNRTKVPNSFILTSALPNSTTEIVIPQVPQATIITIIIFTTLGNVLPTRVSNDSKKSDVHINGDVVVVKVNETLNNISFTFDITDQSLGKPQCVFWNFSLNTWDSTGCEVKQNSTGNITCECNHTTSFSILMSPFSIDPGNQIPLSYITRIGLAISMASLIICLIIEATVWKSVRRNDTSYMRHVSIVNIAVSLLIANICFIIGDAFADEEQPFKEDRCNALSFFMHYFYLALFFWM
ncbi:adhesion G protein-coupled receptor F5-like [Puntigrus tetrazona]|uniref:adhesion G protein-coupled receptor F5-like n=1 Tax=Puntigrus tetrazona TaxID=1606681 RepID=UPI001C8A1068|nr:adhesion G protein-coupled receptor F5-like [Puntigrus tetrazona]